MRARRPRPVAGPVAGLVAGLVTGLTAAALVVPGSSSAAAPASTMAPDDAGTTVHVAPTGSDAATGTFAAPYATFQHAVDRLGPEGGTVVARGGTYTGQRLVLRDRDHVTVRAHADEAPVLDLTGTAPPVGTTGVVEIHDGSDLTVSGLEITGYRTTSQRSVPIGIYVAGATDGLRLTGNHVHHLGNDNPELGSYDTNAHGIAVYGTDPRRPVRGLRITRNEVDHLVLGASESLVVNGNVRGWRIVGNHVHHNNNIGIDAIGYEETLGGAARWTDANRARRGVIARNLVTDIVSAGNPAYWEDPGWCNCADGIYVDGGKDIVVRDNVVRTADIGIEAASEWPQGGTEGIRIVGNDVTGSAYVGIALGGYGPRRGEASDLVVARNVLRGNNTLDDGSPEILLQYRVRDTRVVRNTVTAAGGRPVLVRRVRRVGTAAENAGVRIDRNDYGVLVDVARARFRDAARTYRGLAEWRHGTGHDRHSTLTRRGDRAERGW